MKKRVLDWSLAVCGRRGFLACALAAAACGDCLSAASTRSAGTEYVDAFDLAAASCGQGLKVAKRASVCGHPLTMDGKVYTRGFGARPESAVRFAANGKVTAFDALVGIDDDAAKAGSGKIYGKPTAIFKVWADGRIVWKSEPLKLKQKPVAVHVDLTGAKEIVLETSGGPQWTALDAANGDWADARFTFADGATLESVNDVDAIRQLGIQTPPEKPEPQFNGADIWGVRPGRPVLYRIPVSGVRPMKFTATDLPAGVTLDAAKGILGGVAPLKAGDYDIVVTAENAKGKAVRTIRLAVGDTIALTPPMGWNSWNTLCYRLTAEKAKAAALAMEKSGLADHGWAYINLDDWWEMNNSTHQRVQMRKDDLGGREDVIGPARDANGKINPNRSFPDMKGLTDYIHSFGLKAGLYSSPGPRTCGQCEGSYGHEAQDAESWADWGFDYVKYDWCSYGEIFKKETGKSNWDAKTWEDPALREAYVKPYRLMGDCLRKQKRDIVYSFCQYGMAHVETWGREAGANCWRSWEDLKDGWTWMELAVESRVNGDYWKYAGPGFWADPDMMIVGQQYSFGFDHKTFLTPNEQYTHVSIWAMVCSPLLIGCDLTTMDAFTRALLANDEVIAISQDRLGKPAKRIRHQDAESVWTRPLANGDTAVALVNRYPFAREIKVSFKELGLGAGEHFVRDCWLQKCEGKHSGAYVVEVPAHATKLIRVKPVACGKCE